MPGPEIPPIAPASSSPAGHAAGLIDVLPQHRFDESALWDYLRRSLLDFEPPAHLHQFQGGRSNPTYLLETATRKFVLRKKPAGALLSSAHLIEREFRILRALQETQVPAPRARVLCEDADLIGAPFYVMDYVEGRVFTSATLPAVSPADRRAIYRDFACIAAQLHALDSRALGLFDFGQAEGYVARELDRWTRQYLAAKTEESADMNQLIGWLKTHLPSRQETAIVHGDYRVGNTIVHAIEPRIVAVLDWEFATLGHPLTDLADACAFYRVEPDEAGGEGLAGIDLQALGIPDEQQFLSWYCEFSGRDRIEDWPFFLAFACLRMAAITQGIYARALQGHAIDAQAIGHGEHSKAFAAAGWAIARQLN